MTVDVHPGKAVDQRVAGDLDLLEIPPRTVFLGAGLNSAIRDVCLVISRAGGLGACLRCPRPVEPGAGERIARATDLRRQ
jgi:hypothetical protein